MQLNIKNPGSDFLQKTDDQTIFTDVLATIASSTTKITPAALRKKISDRYGLNKPQIKAIVRKLVISGELSYIYEFGHTFLEPSFAKPVRISEHVVLTPPDLLFRPKPKDVIVKIKPGVSFGNGSHPSTRLAIKAIEFALLSDASIKLQKKASVLDIGTGSGVLILTAVIGGIDGGLGIDIDSCARMEATANVKINGLENRIQISGQSLAAIDQRFTLVLANLRYPSLRNLFVRLTDVTENAGVLILSGIKQNEVANLLETYSKTDFKTLWTADELGWAVVVLQKEIR
jgi:ribosomal protein L11 methyltransferase